MNPLISIILPVYNGEETLERCLNSLIQQDYSNIEIICINDGSKDNSASIIEKYAIKDKRVKYLFQNKSEVSVARNRGLEIALGEWITFCDHDDWVDKNYISSFLMDNPLDEDTLYITGEKEGFMPNKLTPQLDIYKSGVNDENMQDLLQANGTTWGKLYCKDVINRINLRFNTNVFYGEDKIFTMTYLSQVKNVKYNDKVFPYNYVNALNPKKFMKSFDQELFNYRNIVESLRLAFPQTYKPKWVVSSFKLLFYSVFYEKVSKADKIEHLKTLNIECKDVIKYLSQYDGLKSRIFLFLQKEKYRIVLFICSWSIPLVVKVFSSKGFISLKQLLKNMG